MYSFEDNKKQMDVRGFVQRVANASTPNFPTPEGQIRVENRYNRTLPVVLLPWEDDRPAVDSPTYAITKDISDVGLALVKREPVATGRFAFGFWLGAPYYVLGDVRQCVPIGGGFWQVGVHMTEMVNLADIEDRVQLEQLATHLDPEQSPETTSV